MWKGADPNVTVKVKEGEITEWRSQKDG